MNMWHILSYYQTELYGVGRSTGEDLAFTLLLREWKTDCVI